MFVGHYAAAFAVKSEQNKIPLWVLFVAVQLLDFLWAPFILLGIEKMCFICRMSKKCIIIKQMLRLAWEHNGKKSHFVIM